MTASTISNAPHGSKKAPGVEAARKESAYERRRRLRAENAILAPPNPRRRKREARRWLDMLAVRSTNGRVCERRPGARLLSPSEGYEIHRRGFEQLEIRDPELYRAVHRVLWENMLENLDVTSVEEWRRRSLPRRRRLSRVRAEMQRAGSI
jgi:hypothetical protein